MTEKQLKKIEDRMKTLTSIYLIVQYAHWCVRECEWTGRFEIRDGVPIPIVYDYDDHNGTFEEYAKRPITRVTTGFIFDWTFHKHSASKIAEWLEEAEKKRKRLDNFCER